MGIRQRLEDARVLSDSGSRDGAFLQVVIAAAATSRKRYLRDKYSDADSFKNFIYDEMGVITSGPKFGVTLPFEGRETPLEDILYKHLRNNLVHEAEMPESVVFTEPETVDGVVFSHLHLRSPLGFPERWIQSIARAVWLAPENDDLWPDEADNRQQAREQLGSLLWDGLYCRRPKA